MVHICHYMYIASLCNSLIYLIFIYLFIFYLFSVLKEALIGFNAIHGKHNGLGQINDGALVQVSFAF